MASPVSSLLTPPVSGTNGSNNTNNNSSALAAANANNTPTEIQFLQLLVAQIKYQDPLNPTDSTQFVTQLAQFSELQQVVAIRSDIEKAPSPTAPGATGTTPGSNGAAPAGTTPGDTGNPVTQPSSTTNTQTQN